jgi:hypothetical protein
LEVQEYILKLEKNLMLGAGRWLAEFNESFRAFPLNGHNFDLYVRGSTRTKGLLLSRLFAYFALPNYIVGVYLRHTPGDDFVLDDILETINSHAREHDGKWPWLVLVRNGPFTEELVGKVDAFEKSEPGICLVNLEERDIDTSSNLLGRKALSLLRVF